MKRLNSAKTIIVLGGLALAICTITVVAQTIYIEDVREHVLMVGGEELRLTARPELGYVVKARQDAPSISALDGMLKAVGAVDISPIGGLGHKGTCVVYSERSAAENEEAVRLLRSRSEVQYAAPLFSSNGETVAIIPEIVIRMKPGTSIEQVGALCKSAGCTIDKRMEFTEQEYLVEVLGPNAEAVFAAVGELGQAPEVEWACPNTASRPKLCGQAIPDGIPSGEQLWFGAPEHDANSPGVFPNDEYFPRQWHLHNTGQSGGIPGADINGPDAWEITTGDPNIVIAVIGLGVDTHHPDLVNNLVPGYDFLEDDELPDPANNERLDAHDTLCAGLVAAEGNNRIGIAGVTWNCKIMPIRIGSATSWLKGSVIATAFRWAAAHGADILSNSWTGGTSPWPIFLSGVVDITKANGIGRGGYGCVVVFAAGNDNGAVPYPVKYPEVIAVGATDDDDVRWQYSNYGFELDLVAPSGCDGEWCGKMATFWSTDQTGDGGYSILNSDLSIQDYSEYFGGTSASCPIVAGVAALILSVDPNLTSIEVQRILYRSAHDLGERGWDQYYGFGRVDARAAVEMALNPAPFLYVDDDASNDPGPGDPNVSDPYENGLAEHPFDSIQEAIDYALETEKIVVLPGRYTGEGNRNIDFKGKILTVRSESGPGMCLIDCQGEGRAFNFHSGEGPNSVVEGLTIANGTAQYGGAISCTDKSSSTIQHCIFQSNSASLLGGALYLSDANVTVRNCTFSGNTALYGGAVCQVSGTLTLTNCIIWDNTPPEVRVAAGTASVTYSDIRGGSTGAGNIVTDPLFADPANGDYHLKSHGGRWDPVSQSWVIDGITSPCVDAGDPSSPIGDEPQPNGGRINMGAYGGTAEASKSP